MRFNNFIKKLNTALQQHLPAYEAQKLMEPSIRNHLIEKMKFSETPKNCSVLILIYPKNNEIFTVFIKRAKYDGVHSSQIAFPGGQYEKCDGSLFKTALRESNEEIGIDPHDVEIIGNLSNLFVPPSNFNVLPVVAYMNKTPVFDIDKNEVDKIIEISLDDLLDKNIICKKEVQTSENTKLDVPCYFFDGHIIWGATAMVVSELLEVIKMTKI
ncbi:MAG: CoA pyrophosphatase [Bacteroidales bacterium]|nr:CoA pyrophosphatase [Bacteroidales bacterium]